MGARTRSQGTRGLSIRAQKGPVQTGIDLIERIRHRQNAGQKRDRFAIQAVEKSCSVKVLVLKTDDPGSDLKVRHSRNKPKTLFICIACRTTLVGCQRRFTKAQAERYREIWD